MKFKLLILSALLSVAFLAIGALCADWDNQQDLNADQLISGGETAIVTPPAGLAASPKEQRARQANKSSLDWTMPSTLGGSLTSPTSSRASAEGSQTTDSSAATTSSTQENATETNTTAPAASSTSSASTADSELPPSGSAAVTASGSWSLVLNDTVQRDMSLSLFQNGESVYGAGNIREGNSTAQVTASGTAKDGKLNLDVVSVGSIGMFKMALDLNGDAGTGTYVAFSANGDSWQGSAEGLRIASS
jgi:hypothetical protein